MDVLGGGERRKDAAKSQNAGEQGCAGEIDRVRVRDDHADERAPRRGVAINDVCLLVGGGGRVAQAVGDGREAEYFV